MAFEGIDSQTMQIIFGALTCIGGVIGVVLKWSHSQFRGFVGFAKPHIEGFINDQRSLVRTLEATQMKTTENIEGIHMNLGKVEATLQAHSGKLDKIDQNTCPEARSSKALNA